MVSGGRERKQEVRDSCGWEKREISDKGREKVSIMKKTQGKV